METKDKDYTIEIYDFMKTYNNVKEWEIFIKRKKRKTKINNLLNILGDQK